jgi:hypothetical protein
MRKPWRYFLSRLAILLLIPSCSLAQQVLFSSFGPGQTFKDFGFGLYIVPNQPEVLPSELAASFTPGGFTLSGHYTLMQIDLGMFSASGETVGYVAQLTEDAGGIPGAVIETWTVTNPPLGHAVNTLKDTQSVILSSGRQYWVVLVATNFGSEIWDLGLTNSDLLGQNYGLGWVDVGPGGTVITGTVPVSPGLAFDVIGVDVYRKPRPHGVSAGQLLHLVAGPVAPAPGEPVELTLGYEDLNGNRIGPSLTTPPLAPGQTASLDLDANTLVTRIGQRVDVRPVITAQTASGAPPEVTLASTTEVVDKLTGFGTVLARTVDSGNGAPTFGLQGLAGGETLRLTALAREAGATAFNCIAQLSFGDKNGSPIGPTMPVNLSPGTGASLDLNADSLGLGFERRMDVQPIVTLTPPAPGAVPTNSVCEASAEVFDHFTGRTHTEQGASTTALPAVQ